MLKAAVRPSGANDLLLAAHAVNECRATGTDWTTAAVSGMVGVRRYTLFLRSSSEFACDDL
jgi:hypothetical protein